MINRPSYAQRTLELTRRSLQLLPPVPPTAEQVDAIDGADMAMPIDGARERRVAPRRCSLDLGRWRRKAAPIAPIRTSPMVARRLVR